MRHGAQAGQRATELLAGSRVADRLFQRSLGQADGRARDGRPEDAEGCENQVQPLARLTEACILIFDDTSCDCTVRSVRST